MADGESTRWSGRFWRPEQPEHSVGGWLDTTEGWPKADLAEALTPPYRETGRIQQSDGSWMVTAEPADDDVEPETFTVHGFVRGTEGKVTLVDAENHGRNMVLNVLQDRGSERLISRYAVIGEHIAGPEILYRRSRFRLRHLDAWAQLRDGLSVEFAENGSHAAMRYTSSGPQSASTTTTPGTLTLDATLVLPQPSVVEVRFERRAFLVWESAGPGLTIDQLSARLLDPIRSLLTLAADDDCPVTSLHVQQDGGRWLRVVHPGLGAPADELRAGRDMLVTAPDLSLSSVVIWLDKVDQLSPVPQLVAGHVVREGGQVLEGQLLELAAAAEGLHRRLDPNAHVMTGDQAKRARSACLAVVDGEVRRSVSDRLGQFGEPTFRQRMAALGEHVREAIPDITGDTARWTKAVAEARNGFAHLLNAKRETEIEEYLVLRDSLRWLLTALLLLQAGASPETIAGRLQCQQDYQRFRRRASTRLPAIYAQASEEGA
jgi:hypothetical protein